MITALVAAPSVERIPGPPGWRIHRLSGSRPRRWSISVSGNWRITFEEEAGYVDRLNLEDYH